MIRQKSQAFWLPFGQYFRLLSQGLHSGPFSDSPEASATITFISPSIAASGLVNAIE